MTDSGPGTHQPPAFRCPGGESGDGRPLPARQHAFTTRPPVQGRPGHPRTGYEVVVVPNNPIAAGQANEAIAHCPAGKKAIGGGFAGGSQDVVAMRSFPAAPNYDAWTVDMVNNDTFDRVFDVYAICANTTS